jgi:hypothetical protein
MQSTAEDISRTALFGLLTLSIMLLKYQIFGLFILGFCTAWQWIIRRQINADRFDLLFSLVFGVFLKLLALYVPLSIFWIGFTGLLDFQEQIRQEWNMPTPNPPQPDLLTQFLMEFASILIGNSVLVVLAVFAIGVALIFAGRVNSNSTNR